MRHSRPARTLTLISVLGALVAIHAGCAGLAGGGSSVRSESRHVRDFCKAHAMVGVAREVDVALGVRRVGPDGAVLHGSRAARNLVQQELRGYSTRWNHLHQSMNTACRDFAICRLRTVTAAGSECDLLRQRLDEVVARGQRFLLRLHQADGAIAASVSDED